EQVNNMINDYANRLQSQGISFQQFMEITGQKVEDIAEQMKPNAIKRIETRLVLEAIVKAENIEAGEAAIDAEFEKLAENFKMDKEQVKSMFGPEQLDLMKADLAVQEAISFLVAKANLA
ncbi:MAG: trigger factor, partial [Lachnospiraceae bacterium]|nr:trigger factor [Lachnospiraceae bacterium]